MPERLLLSERDQITLSLKLFEDGMFGVKEDPEDYITLKSGRKSPHYFDIRPGVSDHFTRQLVSGMMSDVARTRVTGRGLKLAEAYDHVAGTPEAMTSYAVPIAEKLKLSLLQPRADTNKASGNKAPILGKYQAGDRVAAFDDVITDGKSKIETIEKLAVGGLVVVDYFVVLDREEGGAAQVEAATGIEITPALAVSSMAVILRDENRINQTQFSNISQYLEQYGDPSAQAVMAAA